jgi:hypothetical protein
MTRREAEWLLEAGLAVMLVQGAISDPSAARGARAGAAAAGNARELGFAPGVTLWCDLEAVGDATDADIIGHCNAWHDAVTDAGFGSGLYVGVHSRRLDGDQLYRRLKTGLYWASAMSVADPLPRGYCMAQTRARSVLGVKVDANALWSDELGGLPTWQAPPCSQ